VTLFSGDALSPSRFGRRSKRAPLFCLSRFVALRRPSSQPHAELPSGSKNPVTVVVVALTGDLPGHLDCGVKWKFDRVVGGSWLTINHRQIVAVLTVDCDDGSNAVDPSSQSLSTAIDFAAD